jgi:phosphoribosylaminoimidazole-succinocarboxamide synthase
LKCKKNIIQDENGEKIYLDNEDNSYIVEYKDEIHLEGKRIIKLRDLGSKFSCINAFFFDYLNAYNIPTGYKKFVANTVHLQKHNRFPFTVRIFNIVDKRMTRLFGKKEGEYLSIPIFEFLQGNSKDNLIKKLYVRIANLEKINQEAEESLAIERRTTLRMQIYYLHLIETYNKSTNRPIHIEPFDIHNLKIDPLDLLLKEEENNATNSNVTVLNPKK